jgi:putative transcriptional regulator
MSLKPMSSMWFRYGRFRHLAAVLGVLLASATLAVAALPKGEPEPDGAAIAGQFLVAAPEIGDPRFYHAVILIVRHDKGGAFGIIINHPVGERSMASLMAAIGENTAGVTGNVRLFAGGPVQSWIGFVVHSPDYHRAETIDIEGRVAMTSSLEVLRDIGHDKGPQQRLIAFGYAGWTAGQLEGELAQGAWFTEPEDPKLVFDEDPAKVWDDAMARRTFPL